METLNKYKDSGVKNMNSSKFEEAITDFTKVIDGLEPNNEEEAMLKMTCLSNRSGCYLAVAKREEASKDATEIINIYQKFRPEEIQAKMTNEQIKQDKLTFLLSLAFVRRGNVFESQIQLLEALQQYAQAVTLDFEGAGQMGMRSILNRLGVPQFDQDDPELKPFSELLALLLDPTSLLTDLVGITKAANESVMDANLIKKLNSTGCCRILYAVIQLYLGEEMLVLASLVAIRALVEHGVGDLFAQALITRAVVQNWGQNAPIMGAVLMFLRLLPQQLLPSLNAVDFIGPILKSLDLELKEDEQEAAYYLLLHLMEKEEHFLKVGIEGGISKAISAKTKGSLIFLSKACQLRQNARMLETENGGPDWIFDVISKNTDNLTVLSATSILITHMFMGAADDKEHNLPTPPVEELKKRAEKAYSLMFPAATKFAKEPDLVSNLFAALASCAEFATDYIHQNRAIQAASAILMLNEKDEGCALNIISFLYTCVTSGLVEDVKQTRSAMPTVMKALQQHANNLLLVERAVAIACEVDNPKKLELLKPALEQNPSSPILAKYSSLLV